MRLLDVIRISAAAGLLAACQTTDTQHVDATPAAASADGAADGSQVVSVEYDDGERAEATTADGTDWVCKRIRPTGSRLRERVCKTQAEWDEQELLAQELREEQERHSSGLDPNKPGGF